MNMKIYIISHPDTTNFVFLRREEAEAFVTRNRDIWVQKKVDIRKFGIEEGIIGDKELLKHIKECRPELFL